MHAHKCQFHGSWESLQRHCKDVCVCVGGGIGGTVCGGIGKIVYVCVCGGGGGGGG